MAQLHTSPHALGRPSRPGCAHLAAAAQAILAQCEAFILALPDAAYSAPSSTMRGGTIGKHLRHTLDHFAAPLAVIGDAAGVIDYDARQRNIPMETDRRAAIATLGALRDQLAAAAAEGLNSTVCVRVMIDSQGQSAELWSTLGRELAFATHHAIHHQAMMKAIAAEFGVSVDDQFGKAPSTIRCESATDPRA